MDALFKALNDGTRRQILDLLKQKDLNAGEIASHFSISKPSISHHLDILKNADLIVAIKKGQFIEYSLNTSIMEDMLAWIIGLNQSTNVHKNQERNSGPHNDLHSVSLSDMDME